jgi:hypothetical protein
VPADRSPAELLGLSLAEKQAQLQRLHEPNMGQGARGGQSLGEVAVVESTTEVAKVVGLIHEQMFAQPRLPR